MKKIIIAFAAAEAAPFIKEGGLGDVAGALPKALENNTIDTTLLLPFVPGVVEKGFHLKKSKILKVPFAGKTFNVQLLTSFIPKSKVPVYFFQNNDFLSRGKVYQGKVKQLAKDGKKFIDGYDIIIRYLFWGEAIKQFLLTSQKKFTIYHANDWHSGVVINLIKDDPRLNHIKTFFTIHNMAARGFLKEEHLPYITWNLAKAYDKKRKYYHIIRAIFNNTDAITTVSPQYAKEILTIRYNKFILESLLQNRKKLSGILNGIDYDLFNPATDKKIPYNYSIKNWPDGKLKNKLFVQKLYNIKQNPSLPLIGMPARIFEQKGFSILIPILHQITSLGAQFVCVGDGDIKFEKRLALAAKKDKQSIGFFGEFSVEIAQQIYAGADMVLAPSSFEPCGLTQLIAFAYGAVPIVRATGGLKDTVIDYAQKGNGFSFTPYSEKILLQTIKRAVTLYKTNPKAWDTLVAKIMKQNFSWSVSARKYIALYKNILKK